MTSPIPHPLPQQALDAALRVSLQPWTLAEDGALVRTVHFKNFKPVMALVQSLLALADQADHHPDVHFGYCNVSIRLWTHDCGGLSQRDLDLATQIEALL